MWVAGTSIIPCGKEDDGFLAMFRPEHIARVQLAVALLVLVQSRNDLLTMSSFIVC